MSKWMKTTLLGHRRIYSNGISRYSQQWLQKGVSAQTFQRRNAATSGESVPGPCENPDYQRWNHTYRAQIHRYLDALMIWNQKMNLTGAKTREEAMEHHVMDSLALIPIFEKLVTQANGQDEVHRERRAKLIDIGSGAGFPGLILAIAFPEWEITLVDSLRKRTDFLRAAAEQAEISNVEILWGRAEDFGQQTEYREHYTFATARAVASTRILAELCIPFLQLGGFMIAPKGSNPNAEVAEARNAFSSLGCLIDDVQIEKGLTLGIVESSRFICKIAM